MSLQERLTARGFLVSTFACKEAATAYLRDAIRNTTVAIGGSMTGKEMGLYDLLSQNNRVIWHWMPEEGKTPADALVEARSAEIYLSSVNGLSETGEVVNIDGTCNRVSEIFYGHKKVYLIVGKNKIAPTLEEAVSRARNVAAPRNAMRLGRKTPCAVKGDRCYDCNSPERICNGVQVLLRAPGAAAYEIILIDEALGY
jgi:hypothetical protein